MSGQTNEQPRAFRGKPAAATAAATLRDVDLFRLFPGDSRAIALMAMVKVYARGETRVVVHDRVLWEELGWSERTYRRVKARVAEQLIDARGEPLIRQRRHGSHGGLIACQWTIDRRRIAALSPKPELQLIAGAGEDADAGARAAFAGGQKRQGVVPTVAPGKEILKQTIPAEPKDLALAGMVLAPPASQAGPDAGAEHGNPRWSPADAGGSPPVPADAGAAGPDVPDLPRTAPAETPARAVSEREVPAIHGPPGTEPPGPTRLRLVPTAGQLEQLEQARQPQPNREMPDLRILGDPWDDEQLEHLAQLRGMVAEERARHPEQGAGVALAAAVARLKGRGVPAWIYLPVITAELAEHDPDTARDYHHERRRFT